MYHFFVFLFLFGETQEEEEEEEEEEEDSSHLVSSDLKKQSFLTLISRLIFHVYDYKLASIFLML